VANQCNLPKGYARMAILPLDLMAGQFPPAYYPDSTLPDRAMASISSIIKSHFSARLRRG